MGGFRHEALLYSGEREFLDAATSFIRDGLHADDDVLVAVRTPKIDKLRALMGAEGAAVSFVDMAELGRNPARIIPAWRDFARDHTGPGRRMRGIGEPIWAQRSAAELVECQRHESVLNVAFADAPDLILMCSYDTAELDPTVVQEAHRSHPFIRDGNGQRESRTCRTIRELSAPFDAALPEPAATAETGFTSDTLSQLRDLVRQAAEGAEITRGRADDLVSAVNEAATNSVRHAGGQGTLRCWQERESLICEVRDQGGVDDPLAGYVRPPAGQPGGFGLWLVNQLCDLVQIRSYATGGAVRMHMRLDG